VLGHPILVGLPEVTTLAVHSAVVPRLGLGIHEFRQAGLDAVEGKLVDPKAKPWDDDRECW
jgi:hypothetical protein